MYILVIIHNILVYLINMYEFSSYTWWILRMNLAISAPEKEEWSLNWIKILVLEPIYYWYAQWNNVFVLIWCKWEILCLRTLLNSYTFLNNVYLSSYVSNMMLTDTSDSVIYKNNARIILKSLERYIKEQNISKIS